MLFHTHTLNAVNKSNQILTVTKKYFMYLDMVHCPTTLQGHRTSPLGIAKPHLGPHYKLDQQAVLPESPEESNQGSARVRRSTETATYPIPKLP